MKKNYESHSEIKVSGDFRIGDITNNKTNISKVQSVLNFDPIITLDADLEVFCKCVIGPNNDDRGYERSLPEMEQSCNSVKFLRLRLETV